jgi:hypothetical protein
VKAVGEGAAGERAGVVTGPEAGANVLGTGVGKAARSAGKNVGRSASKNASKSGSNASKNASRSGSNASKSASRSAGRGAETVLPASLRSGLLVGRWGPERGGEPSSVPG